MISIGTGGIPYYAKSAIDAMEKLSSRGLMAMEVEFVHGVRMSPEKADELGRARPEEFHLTAHAPYYINLLNPEKKEASMKRIFRTLDRANRFGAPSIAVHPGYYGKLAEKQAMEEMDAATGEIEDWMAENGIKTKLGYETTGRVSQFGTLGEILELMKSHKRLTAVVDFAHIYARNGGKIDYASVLDRLKGFKQIHAHFSSINYGPKGEKNHLPVPEEKPSFRELVKEITARGWHRKKDWIFICESPQKEEDAEYMLSIARELA